MKRLKTFSNILFYALLSFLIFRMAESYWHSSKQTGQSLAPVVVTDLVTNQSITLPEKDQRQLFIFWASWCGPCLVEMTRLQKAVDDKTIKPEQIIAMNAFEPVPIIRDFIKKQSFSFRFVSEQTIADKLEIRLTPTTLFINNRTVEHMSSGMSLIGIWRAEQFLKN